jgi:hypothetical protein
MGLVQLNFRHSAATPVRAGGFLMAEIFMPRKKVFDMTPVPRGRHSTTSVHL